MGPCRVALDVLEVAFCVVTVAGGVVELIICVDGIVRCVLKVTVGVSAVIDGIFGVLCLLH